MVRTVHPVPYRRHTLIGKARHDHADRAGLPGLLAPRLQAMLRAAIFAYGTLMSRQHPPSLAFLACDSMTPGLGRGFTRVPARG